jgi:hypothetical protein
MMMTRRRVSAAGVLLLCLGCGSSGGNNNNNPSLSVSPSTTTVIAGGTAVSFTATLSNATGTVSWTLTGPGSITPSTGTTTSYTPPAAVASATTATLTASADAFTRSSTITINPPAAITVAGVVVDSSLRKFPGVSVFIGAQSTVTDANGHFSIANVTPPYDLTVLATVTSPGGPAKGASLFKGLTRTDPVIILALYPTSTDNMGTLTGTVTGGDAPGTFGVNTVVSWVSTPAPLAFANPRLEINSSPYSLDVTWDVALSSITGNMHVLQWEHDCCGRPKSYTGYAVKTGVAVAAGGTTNNVNLAMSAPGTLSVGGSVTVPSGVTLGTAPLRSAALSFDDTAQIDLGFDGSSGTSFSYLYPNITGATAVVSASGYSASGDLMEAKVSGIALGTTNVSIALPSPISVITPADSATSIGTDVDFSWTAFSGGNVVYIFEAIGPLGQPSYQVFTTATSTRIPDLSAQGMGLPSAAAYSWSVIAVAPHASVDSAAGPKSILPTGNTVLTAGAGGRTFTTP